MWQKICICRRFPVYRWDEIDDLPVGELLQAIELMDTADNVITAIRSAHSG